ncbi:MAG: alpha-ribazole phosphatase [Chloroflexi bacterium]|nr:alpha-ribazole phosphatase [Chloroflexota bacterium]
MKLPTTGRLLLSRHGQTEFNAGARYQGQTDTPLSDLGREQARRLAERLAREDIDAAYASDLSRARETAEIALGERAIPLQLDARLREMAFGRWEGLTFAEIEKKYPADVVARERDRVHFAQPGGGESLVQLGARVVAFLAQVLPKHEGQSLLLVAHGGTLNAAIASILDIPLSSWSRLRNHNGNLSVIELGPGGPCLRHFNDTCHLDTLAELKWP